DHGRTTSYQIFRFDREGQTISLVWVDNHCLRQQRSAGSPCAVEIDLKTLCAAEFFRNVDCGTILLIGCNDPSEASVVGSERFFEAAVDWQLRVVIDGAPEIECFTICLCDDEEPRKFVL